MSDCLSARVRVGDLVSARVNKVMRDRMGGGEGGEGFQPARGCQEKTRAPLGMRGMTKGPGHDKTGH